MNASSYIGRIGGLAVALGVGAAVFAGQGTAWAADGDNASSGSAGSSKTGSGGGTASGSSGASSTGSGGGTASGSTGSSATGSGGGTASGSSGASSTGSGGGTASGSTGSSATGSGGGTSSGSTGSSATGSGGGATSGSTDSSEGGSGDVTPADSSSGADPTGASTGTQGSTPMGSQDDQSETDPSQQPEVVISEPEATPETVPDGSVEEPTQSSGNEGSSGITPQQQDGQLSTPSGGTPTAPVAAPADASDGVISEDTSPTETSLSTESPALPEAALTGSWLPSDSPTASGSFVSRAMVTTQPAADDVTAPAPKLFAILHAMFDRILHPIAGNAPGLPTGEAPVMWVMLAAARGQLSRGASTLASPGATPGSTTLILNGESYTITPAGPEVMTGIYNASTAGPAVNESIQGYQKFNLVDENGDVADTFYAYVSTAPYRTPYLSTAGQSGASSQVLYVDSGIAELLGESPGAGLITDGSVISTYSNGSLRNVYSAIAGDDPNSGSDDTVTDILTNVKTGKVSDLSGLINGLGFNAAYVPPTLPSYIRGVGVPKVTSVSALPPLTIGLQGIQEFEHLDDNGNPDGRFYAVITTTEDTIGFKTQALLVTGYPEGAEGSSPAVGTVFNTIDYGNLSIVYRSEPQADGSAKVTVTVSNKLRPSQAPLDVSWLYQGVNASDGLTDGSNIGSFQFGDGYTVERAPGATEVFNGVNGLPPVSATVSSSQVFTVMHNGEPVGEFTAVVTTTPKMLLTEKGQALLVIDSSSPDVPVGSVFDVSTVGFGFQRVYADLVGTGDNGQNAITLTQVSPWGTLRDLSWLVQNNDAAAGLDPANGDVSFNNDAWLELFTKIAPPVSSMSVM